MATEWYVMKKTTHGGEEETELQWHKQTFEMDVLQSPFAKTVSNYGDKITNTPVISPMLVQDVTPNRQNGSELRTVVCEIGRLQCGDLLSFDSQWWLVFDMVSNNTIYEKAQLQYCKVQIKFAIPGTSTVVTYPVPTLNATQYNSGEKEKVYITYGSSERIVYVPYNADTIKVDHGFRIMMDRNTANPTVWKVSQVDAESYDYGGHGLIRWTLLEDNLRDTDDIMNHIADNSEYNDIHKSTARDKAEDWGL